MTPFAFDLRVDPPSVDWDDLHRLISAAYGFMHGRIDPPSSLLAMSPVDLERKAAGERLVVVSADDELIGCLFCRRQADWLYIGKMAVAPSRQRSGVGRALIGAASDLATEGGLAGLELETRIELTENHRAFGGLGFVKVAETSHPGYTSITSITMRLPLGGRQEQSTDSARGHHSTPASPTT